MYPLLGWALQWWGGSDGHVSSSESQVPLWKFGGHALWPAAPFRQALRTKRSRPQKPFTVSRTWGQRRRAEMQTNHWALPTASHPSSGRPYTLLLACPLLTLESLTLDWHLSRSNKGISFLSALSLPGSPTPTCVCALGLSPTVGGSAPHSQLLWCVQPSSTASPSPWCVTHGVEVLHATGFKRPRHSLGGSHTGYRVAIAN